MGISCEIRKYDDSDHIIFKAMLGERITFTEQIGCVLLFSACVVLVVKDLIDYQKEQKI